MSVQIYRSIEHVAGARGVRATIYESGKSVRIEIWRAGRRLDTRRCSPARGAKRTGELIEFWSADQPDGNEQ